MEAQLGKLVELLGLKVPAHTVTAAASPTTGKSAKRKLKDAATVDDGGPGEVEPKKVKKKADKPSKAKQEVQMLV